MAEQPLSEAADNEGNPVPDWAASYVDRVVKVAKLMGYVNTTDDLAEVAAVVNGASEVMVEVFGQEIGAHARTVAGVTVMPFGVAIEIEADFLIE